MRELIAGTVATSLTAGAAAAVFAVAYAVRTVWPTRRTVTPGRHRLAPAAGRHRYPRRMATT